MFNYIFKLFFFIFFTISYSLFAQQEAVFSGLILNNYGDPIDHVMITLQENNQSTISSENGRFEITVPANKIVHLYFQHISSKDTLIPVSLKSGEKSQITLILPSIGERLAIVDVRGRADDGFTRVDPKLSFKLPSPSGGIESLIKMLPGASSTNELSSQYNVRGGNYDENLIFVNDIQIYRPFLVRSGQQEGLSFVNTDLTNSVKFSAGGFEAKYGDKMSSVLDVEYKHPTRYAGSASASLLGASVHAEGNVKDVFTFLVGVRYKSNAYLLKSLQTKGDYKPRFFDTQMLLTWNPVKKLEISLLGNFSKNQYLFIPSDRETKFGSAFDAKKLTVYFDGQEVDNYENYLGGLTFKFKADKNNLYKLIISSYYAKESETYDIQSQYWLNDIEADWGSQTNDIAREVSLRGVGTFLEHARNYIKAVVSAADIRGEHHLKNNFISWGVKMQNEIIQDNIKEWALTDSSGYVLPNDAGYPGEEVPLDDPSRLLSFGKNSYLKAYNELNTFRFTGFVQDLWKIDGDNDTRFFLLAGVRFHYWTFNHEFTASPRLSFVYKPRWKHDWEFRLKTGLYYQPAFYREMRDKEGNLNHSIKSQRSYQVVLSSEYNFRWWRRPFKFTAEAYYKYMDHLISYSIDNVRIDYSGKNDAFGYATGIDMKLSGEFIRGLESWISLSLMKTEENIIGDYYYNKNGQLVEPGYIPRPTDQRFSVNLFFQDHIPFIPQVRVHLNFVFASGLPYGAPDTERYAQTLRMSWYRRVDIGFSYMFLEQSRDRMKNKSKFIRSIKNAGVFVEVFNVLGINNVSSYMWVKDINNQLFPVPNYLTPRLVNVKLAVEF